MDKAMNMLFAVWHAILFGLAGLGLFSLIATLQADDTPVWYWCVLLAVAVVGVVIFAIPHGYILTLRGK